LKNHARYLSGVICREFKIRFGPEIRFFLSESAKQYEQLKFQFDEIIPEIAKQKLKEMGVKQLSNYDWQQYIE